MNMENSLPSTWMASLSEEATRTSFSRMTAIWEEADMFAFLCRVCGECNRETLCRFKFKTEIETDVLLVLVLFVERVRPIDRECEDTSDDEIC